MHADDVLGVEVYVVEQYKPRLENVKLPAIEQNEIDIVLLAVGSLDRGVELLDRFHIVSCSFDHLLIIKLNEVFRVVA